MIVSSLTLACVALSLPAQKLTAQAGPAQRLPVRRPPPARTPRAILEIDRLAAATDSAVRVSPLLTRVACGEPVYQPDGVSDDFRILRWPSGRLRYVMVSGGSSDSGFEAYWYLDEEGRVRLHRSSDGNVWGTGSGGSARYYEVTGRLIIPPGRKPPADPADRHARVFTTNIAEALCSA